MDTRRRGTSLGSAFTLIELLVVVSIIVVLLAILLPSTSQAVRAAEESQCMSNMRQVAVGIHSYASDSDGRLPYNRMLVASAQHWTWRWTLKMSRYIVNDSLWICPGQTAPAIENYFIHGSQCVGDVASNYAYNGTTFWAFGPNGAPDGTTNGQNDLGVSLHGLSLFTLRRPAMTFAVLESRAGYPDLGNWTIGSDWGDGGGAIGFWHRSGSHWAFADGHAQWERLPNTFNANCWWHNLDPSIQDSHPDWYAGMPKGYGP